MRFLVEQIERITNENGDFKYCPIFDNGASLLSDTTMDYSLNVDIVELVKKVKSKTFSSDFDEQLEAAEKLYGQHLKFKFDKKIVEDLFKEEKYYNKDIKERVEQLIYLQMRKYQYLFN